MGFPYGYHITFATYGNRLHGSNKPHVDRDHNQYGQPLAPTDPEREDAQRRRMKQDPVRLTPEQRVVVERAIRDLAGRYRWPVHAFASQSDHTHVVAGYYDDPSLRTTRNWLDSAREVDGVIGYMYTTWRQDYDRVEAFANLCRAEK
jgi:hypothetical protein